jgi:TPR repeat protein
MFNLGVCYEKGRGVEVNILEARSWYEVAALSGHALSVQKLAQRRFAEETTAALKKRLSSQPVFVF